jgi:cephalosporin hydroxylase
MELSDILYTKANNAAQRVGMGFIKIPFAEFAGSADDVPMSERSLTPMHEAFYSNTGPIVHKWRHYLSIYHRHLEKYRSQPFRLLEIGVYKGGSLLMWRRYFGEAATIYGIDIDESCAAHDGKGGHVRIGSQADPSFLLSVVRQMGGIDVVIDDGSHVAQHQRASFNTLFPMLSEN